MKQTLASIAAFYIGWNSGARWKLNFWETMFIGVLVGLIILS